MPHYEDFSIKYRQHQLARATRSGSGKPPRKKKKLAEDDDDATTPPTVPGWTMEVKSGRGSHTCSCYISNQVCALGKLCSSSLLPAWKLCASKALSFLWTGDAELGQGFLGNFFAQSNLRFCQPDLEKYIIPSLEKRLYNQNWKGPDAFSHEQYISVANGNALKCCHCQIYGPNGSHGPRFGDLDEVIPPAPPTDSIHTYVYAPSQHNLCETCFSGSSDNFSALADKEHDFCRNCLTGMHI